MTDWFGGRGQGKWLTGLVAGGKANDWLMRWRGDAVAWWCSDVVAWWCGDTVVGGKANDWLVWWQGARQMTDWLGGRGQGKWLTNAVMRWRGGRGQGKWLTGLVAGGKANDWLMRWRGDAVAWWCSDVVAWWCGDTVVGGKANDWLVWWQGARQMTDWLGGRGQGKWLTNAVMRWRGGRGQGKWLTGLVAGGKANDWLVWWQGARQMTD